MEAIRMPARQHQLKLIFAEPSCIFQFGTIECDRVISGFHNHADHQA